MKEYMTKPLKTFIVIGIVYWLFTFIIIFYLGEGYIDSATGAFVKTESVMMNYFSLLSFFLSPIIVISIFASIIYASKEFRKHNNKGAIAIIVWMVLMIGVPIVTTEISSKFGPKEALAKTEVCKKSIQCSEKDGDITVCYYHNEPVKCPVAIIRDYQYTKEEKK